MFTINMREYKRIAPATGKRSAILLVLVTAAAVDVVAGEGGGEHKSVEGREINKQ